MYSSTPKLSNPLGDKDLAMEYNIFGIIMYSNEFSFPESIGSLAFEMKSIMLESIAFG